MWKTSFSVTKNVKLVYMFSEKSIWNYSIYKHYNCKDVSSNFDDHRHRPYEAKMKREPGTNVNELLLSVQRAHGQFRDAVTAYFLLISKFIFFSRVSMKSI